MTSHHISRYAKPVPRYTSYPTAPHFHDGIGPNDYGSWLNALGADEALSLYVHIPFCDRLCWFCGCTTKQTHQYAPVAAYLEILEKEIDMVARQLEGRGKVSALHFGGGSPTLLTPHDMRMLNELLRRRFSFVSNAEISVEIDPSDMDEPRHQALADIGLTRTSLGVQDFDTRVQIAINREQSFEQTKAVVDATRAHGARSVNLDVLYGLPHQTQETIASTIEQVVSLHPDRIALFGYAHVPWMKKHQRLIDENVLPDVPERFAQQALAAQILLEAGYKSIGIDHFALPGDSLTQAACEGHLRRNFQGYTTDDVRALIGLGASSIGQLPQGYVQNTPASGNYKTRIEAGDLAVVRGYALNDEDRIRAYVIERLMCTFQFSATELVQIYGDLAEPVLAQAESLVTTEPNGYFTKSGDVFAVSEAGRPFVRSFAAVFDDFLVTGKARHSIAI